MIDKVEFNKLPFFGKYLPFIDSINFYVSFYLYAKFSKLNKYDIVHNLNPTNPIKKSNVNILITTIHDLVQIYYPNLIYGAFDEIPYVGYFLKSAVYLDTKIQVFALKHNLNLSNYFIANSTQTKNELLEYGIEKNKIFITPMGVDERFLENNHKFNLHQYFNVGYLGGLVPKKNIKFIFDSSKYTDDKTIIFSIYGQKTNYFNLLFKYYSKYKNMSKIKFRGFVPENKLVDIYDSFDVFVFPSLHEGFGQPILEAQARGLPVIIYKYGKIPKEVRKYCFEAESPEHMAQIIMQLKENGYNEKLQKKATAYARSFTWKKTAQKTLNVYKSILKRE